MRALGIALLALGVGAAGGRAQQSRLEEMGNALERAAVARAAARASADFDETFRKYSKRYFGPAWDWKVFKAQAMAESSLNPEAQSHVGARGLMQLMPSTYQMIQTRRPEFGSIDDPEWNIAAGIYHDRYLWRLWSKDITEAERQAFMFASYNAGEGTIARATLTARAENLDHSRWPNIEVVAPKVPRWRYQETLGYVRRIEGYFEALRASR
jgi:membrane-bound lytic murein transglycosylase F